MPTGLPTNSTPATPCHILHPGKAARPLSRNSQLVSSNSHLVPPPVPRGTRRFYGFANLGPISNRLLLRRTALKRRFRKRKQGVSRGTDKLRRSCDSRVLRGFGDGVASPLPQATKNRHSRFRPCRVRIDWPSWHDGVHEATRGRWMIPALVPGYCSLVSH